MKLLLPTSNSGACSSMFTITLVVSIIISWFMAIEFVCNSNTLTIKLSCAKGIVVDMLINYARVDYSSHWILLSSFPSTSLSSLAIESPSSPCLLFTIVLLTMYKLLGFVFSFIIVGFSGQILTTLNLDKMFFLVMD